MSPSSGDGAPLRLSLYRRTARSPALPAGRSRVTDDASLLDPRERRGDGRTSARCCWPSTDVGSFRPALTISDTRHTDFASAISLTLARKRFPCNGTHA